MTNTTPSDDASLAGQPAPYWTRLAYESTTAFTRRGLAAIGCTHPQYWLLRHLDTNDLAEDEAGRTTAELEQVMAEYLREEDDLDAESTVLIARGWLVRDGDRLRITEAGKSARVTIAGRIPAIRTLIHDGIDEADYVTTIKVLQRLIQNTR